MVISGIVYAQSTNPVVQNNIAVLILVGKQDPKAMYAARNLYHIFEKSHPEPTGNDEQVERKTDALAHPAGHETTGHQAIGSAVRRGQTTSPPSSITDS